MEQPGDARTVQRALTAAHLYYVQDRTMDAIARELGTSRSTVSRLLTHARATGIVDIRIRSPFAALARLAACIVAVAGAAVAVGAEMRRGQVQHDEYLVGAGCRRRGLYAG